MLLWFTAYILIPAYTILFVQGNNWFTTNFSVIGNVVGREGEFVLWGLIVGIYFFGVCSLLSPECRCVHGAPGLFLFP